MCLCVREHDLIKAWMSLNIGQILLLTMELAAFECLEHCRFHFLLVAIDEILFKIAYNEDIHNLFNARLDH